MQLKLKFFYKIFNNLIDCPELLQDINIRINPINSRNTIFFLYQIYLTNYMLNSPSNILKSAGNSKRNLDFFLIILIGIYDVCFENDLI